jgi:N-acetylmuramoyl-L-alanine amidase
LLLLEASAKLIKKGEQKMTTGNNNGKQSIYNISGLKLLFLLIILFGLSCSLLAVKKEKRWTVVIDAGHGDKDPGAIGAISFEKNITLAIALKTGKYIEENISNINVIYTRTTDTFVELKERAEIANRNNADLFISIHANSGKKTVQGTETFIMGRAKDEQNLAVAMKENEVILLENDHSAKYEGFDPKSPESYIMFTLMQNVYQEQSTGLASKIQSQYKEKLSRVDRGVKQAGFWVLFMTTMPSVLTETGFITNPDEEKYLNSKPGQDYISSCIYRAVRDYFAEIESKSVVITGDNQYAVNVPPASNPDQSVSNTESQSSKQDQAVTKKENPSSKTEKSTTKTEQSPSKTGQSPAKTGQSPSKTELPVLKARQSSSNKTVVLPKTEQVVTQSGIPFPGEVRFTVEIAASIEKLPLNPANFKGLKDIAEFEAQDSYRYTTGSFSDFSSAARYRKKIELIYPDAFVIAVKDDKILPLQQAMEFLKKNKINNK